MEDRLAYKVQQFKDAVLSLEESLSINLKGLSAIVVDSIKSGRAQKFEICLEILWKTLQIYLRVANGIEANSPKNVIKECYNLGLVTASEFESIMEMIDDRNRLSHVYNKQQFEEIYQRIIKRLPLFTKVLKVLS